MVPTNETTTTKKPDFNKANIKKAIAQGKEMIKSGMSKADVSREIYDLVKDDSGDSGSTTTEPEKGRKKCSDGIDNDGDGLIDSNDPECN